MVNGREILLWSNLIQIYWKLSVRVSVTECNECSSITLQIISGLDEILYGYLFLYKLSFLFWQQHHNRIFDACIVFSRIIIFAIILCCYILADV